jgi:hypothetical protein
MLTSIFLCLALLPAQFPLQPCLPDVRAELPALARPPIERPDPLGLICAEIADEESEEEEDEGPEPADHRLAVIVDAGLGPRDSGSNGSPHIPLARDCRRLPRSPPRDGSLPALQRVRASIG